MMGSFIGHVGLLLWAAASIPTLHATSEPEDVDPPVLIHLRVYADESEASSPSSRPPPSREDLGEHGVGPSRCCDGDGRMGDPDALGQDGRYAVAGPADNPDPHIARAGGRGYTWDMWGPYLQTAGADPDSPTAPWGRDEALGTDALSARGALWADEAAPSLGANGMASGGGILHEPDGAVRDDDVAVAAPSYERHRHRGYQQDALRGWD